MSDIGYRARAAAAETVKKMRETVGFADDIVAWWQAGFGKGAEWALEQEPTDAEVLAALNSDYALRYGGRGGPAESLELYGDEHVQIMRAALVAARNARQGK